MGVSFLSCETEKSLLLSLPPSSIFSSQANKHSSISFLILSLGYQVEVRLREGRAVNIHMFCARRPGLLLSTMRALDNLGLDIQQAVINYFNGFALDVFRAEVPFFFLFIYFVDFHLKSILICTSIQQISTKICLTIFDECDFFQSLANSSAKNKAI
uniref:Plant bHLH transcription factor ACT-like domain-containing protein n=1 Tax=Gossypium raimondii TaxID=29730 RepID=A0A0D2NMD7_GOSRA|nr:hypothetical protein B456_006G058000 [Gossypium raimondii]KJB34298.1 hypothetical protein B456_006G058000 [Gossypium raimondii]